MHQRKNWLEFTWSSDRIVALLGNVRQRLMLNKQLDGFEGKLTTTRLAKITKTWPSTALRDVQDLIAKSILQKEPQGGRSTSYELV